MEELGGVYGPYTGTWFGSMKETDIEHSSHPGGHRRQDDVQVKLVDSVMRGKELLCPQVEDAVGAQGRGRPVIKVEEPYGAVDQGETHSHDGIHRPDRQTVEGKLAWSLDWETFQAR